MEGWSRLHGDVFYRKLALASLSWSAAAQALIAELGDARRGADADADAVPVPQPLPMGLAIALPAEPADLRLVDLVACPGGGAVGAHHANHAAGPRRRGAGS